MPHKCVNCGKLYQSNSVELFKGCSCNSRVFLFLRDEQVSLKEQVELFEREGRELVDETLELQKISEIAPISIEKAEEKKMEIVNAAEEVEEKLEIAGGAEEQAAELLFQEAFKEEPGQAAENITILEKGSYELDINSLMAGNPLVIKSEKGVFYIRIPSSVKKSKVIGSK